MMCVVGFAQPGAGCDHVNCKSASETIHHDILTSIASQVSGLDGFPAYLKKVNGCIHETQLFPLKQIQMEYSAGNATAARSLQLFVYLYTSMATFWTYDYICSLHEEWTFLLRSHWTKVKALYIIARYVPFVITTMNLYRASATVHAIPGCHRSSGSFSFFIPFTLLFVFQLGMQPEIGSVHCIHAPTNAIPSTGVPLTRACHTELVVGQGPYVRHPSEAQHILLCMWSV
ncbi:uncharacterized protein BJ212DRAFT_618852 [Suillus subaureus]|uniref:DUF6533 domain-containing protein n=1 Tax=Suillus subaureus TaxID=48587 RepID=A0A9P7E1T0_9AGAM|nr:uncharacterized protein BJ212DRAFT_618852 [Suillus subaureus]KAG1809139.1 hypothetical protein BJ212DRAFT_618852 [Suillus subaureus]